MTRQKSFTTAAARRRANPIEWVIDENVVRLRSNVDLTEIADAIDALQAPSPEGVSEIRASESKRQTLCDVVRTFLEPGAHKVFDSVEKDLDFAVLTDMVQDLIVEYTGQTNPTQQPSLSDGLPSIGSNLTAGAEQEG
jgi:hypothetical protein